jgi:hypothetical protein
VKVDPNTAYECTVRVPGYYPATFAFTHEMVFEEAFFEANPAGIVRNASLLVPLQKVEVTEAIPGQSGE